MALKVLFSVMLLTGALFGLFSYFSASVDHAAIEILASEDPAFAEPVYAQFVYTQSLQLSRLIELSEIIIPIYIEQGPPRVRLFRAGQLVQEWAYPDNTTASGLIRTRYKLDTPVLADGTLEIQIDGGEFSHEDQDRAPRIFIEDADYAYPNGNYRIAENEKEGDIALTLIEKTSRWSIWIQSLAHRPYDRVAQFVFGFLVLLVIGFLPFLISSHKKASDSV